MAILIGVSIPIFFLALILKYIFAVRLGWLPSIGRQDVLVDAEHPTNFYVLDGIITRNWQAAWDADQHLILPAIALGTIPLALIARITRASVLDVQNEDYVRTARAKGISRLTVERRHVLRNAMLPVATVIGLQVGLLLSGAILTETVFAFPGIGTWIQEAISNRDYAGAPGRDALHRHRRRARQPARRPLLRVAQPAHPAGGAVGAVSAAEIEARELELHTPTGGLWSDALRRVLRNPGRSSAPSWSCCSSSPRCSPRCSRRMTRSSRTSP